MSQYTPVTYESVTGNFPCRNEKIQIHGHVGIIGVASVVMEVWNAAHKTKHPFRQNPNALPMVTGEQYWSFFSNVAYPTQDFSLPRIPPMVSDLSTGTPNTGQRKQIRQQHAYDIKLRLDAETIDGALQNLFLSYMPKAAAKDWNRNLMVMSDKHVTVERTIEYFANKYGKTNLASR